MRFTDVDLDAMREAHREEIERFKEGSDYTYQRKLERESRAATLAKAHHGYRCQACDMTFSEVYGELGADSVEAHHLVPLADIEPGAERTYAREDLPSFAAIATA